MRSHYTYVHKFLNDLWLNYSEIINKCNWSIKLGLKFEDFSLNSHVFYHSFWNTFYNSAYIEELMKRNLIDKKIFDNNFNFALHFDVSALFDYIYDIVKDIWKIKILRKNVWEIISEWKNIKGILCDWNLYEANLYLDCSWFKRILISTVADKNFIDYWNIIYNNNALVYRTDYMDKWELRVPYTTCKGTYFWWIWNIPLKNKISFWYIHNKKNNVEEDFIKYLNSKLWCIDKSKITEVSFSTWRNKEHIVGNVFAIWLSSAFIEPIESTWLYFIVRNIELLWSLLKWDSTTSKINSLLNNDYDSVLNFILAHYKYSNRNNEYWNLYKNKVIKDYKFSNLFKGYSWYKILNWFNQNEIITKNIWEKNYLRNKSMQNKFSDKPELYKSLPNYNYWIKENYSYFINKDI